MSDRNVTPNTATSSQDRLTEIRARLASVESRNWFAEWEEVARPGCVDDVFIAHAPADIAWLLSELALRDCDTEDIYDLRDQVNAGMDTIHHLAGNGQQFEWAMDYYAQRVKKQRQTRRPHSD